MTKRAPEDTSPAEVAKRRDAALLKMLKTPPKKQEDDKKPRAKAMKRSGVVDPWKPR